MRIFVTNNYYPSEMGGIEQVTHQLVVEYLERGHEVIWAAYSPRGRAPERVSPRPGLELLPLSGLDVRRAIFSVPYPVLSNDSRRRIRAAVGRCDAVHAHDAITTSSVVALRAAAKCKIPRVLTQYVGVVPYSNPLLRLAHHTANMTLGRMSIRNATAVTYINETVRQYFTAGTLSDEKWNFIPYGIDHAAVYPPTGNEREQIRARLGLAPAQKVVLFIGRFVEKKGLNVIRDAAARLPDVRFLLVGAGPIDPAGWNLANVALAGTKSPAELRQYYLAADLLALPARGEGFPQVVQQAAACGLPCVVSDEITRGYPGSEQFLASCPPNGEALAATLKRLLDNPAARQQLSANGIRFAKENWSWEVSAQKHLTVCAAS